jgi:alkaline phosphatase D
MRYKLLFLWVMPLWVQAQVLRSGPMVAYSTMKEVALWVQLNATGSVHFEYWDKSKPNLRYKTSAQQAQEREYFIVQALADKLEPGIKYAAELFVNGKKVSLGYAIEFQSQQLWQWRTSPPAFSFVAGSCAYINDSVYDRPGKPYGGDYRIFQSIAAQKPDFMLWVGDNVYLREADYDSRTGIFYRYAHSRALPELQPLLAQAHHYAIWDDHDFGPNDSDASYPLKEHSQQAFKAFWPSTNYGCATSGKGTYSSFVWADCQFFMLDNRYFRTANSNQTGARTILGDEQIQWLINGLSASRATFKFVVIGGQLLNPAAVYENYATYPKEREELIALIRKSAAKGVFFISGDRHHTVLSLLKENEKAYPLYELTTSPLTSSPHANPEKNLLALDSTLVTQRNFALMRVEGEKQNRSLNIEIYDTDAKLLWKKKIAAKELE